MPAPTTTAVSPALAVERRTACTATETASIIAAASKESPSGSL